MSRAYRISVAESLSRHVKVEDGIATSLELLEILPRERMAELLAAELLKLGFERDGDRVKRTDEDGLEIEVDLPTGQVTVRISAEADLEARDQLSGAAAKPDDARAEEQLRGKLRKTLEGRVQAQQEDLRREVSARLERKLVDLRAELDAAVGRATGEALKQKAAQLGEIEEISENQEDGSLTIRVRV